MDAWLPAFDFSESHARDVVAPPRAVIAAVAGYRPETDPFFRRMIGLRELPMRLGQLVGGARGESPPPFGIDNFTLLEKDDDGALVYGLAGRFWRPGFGLAAVADAAAFRVFNAPGVPRLVLGFFAAPAGNGMTRLTTETRIACPDAASRLKFAPYWYLIRPVSGLIRARLLAGIAAACESAPLPAPAA